MYFELNRHPAQVPRTKIVPPPQYWAGELCPGTPGGASIVERNRNANLISQDFFHVSSFVNNWYKKNLNLMVEFLRFL